jgi:hypothetical protein
MNLRAFVNRPAALRTASGGLSVPPKSVTADFHSTRMLDGNPANQSNAHAKSKDVTDETGKCMGYPFCTLESHEPQKSANRMKLIRI